MSRKRRLALLKFAVSLVLLILLYGRTEFGRLRAVLGDLRLYLLPLLFVLLLFNTFISALKWRILLRADAIHVPLPSLVGSYLVGSFFNVFLPSNIGGDVYRVYDVARRTDRPAHTFASVFADRLSGFAALAVLGIAFPLLGWALVEDRRILLLPVAVFAAIAAAVYLLYQRELVARFLARVGANRVPHLQQTVNRFLDSIGKYRETPGVVPRVMAVSFVFQFTIILYVFLLARTMRSDIPFAYFCVFVPLISLMEAVPLTIYGIGFRDAGYVLFFTQLGKPVEHAMTLSLLYVVSALVYASLGGIVFVVRTRNAPPDTRRADEE